MLNTQSSSTDRLFALLLITTSTVLMQWHSIEFWTAYTGLIGIGWSLATEGVSLWFWWQRHTLLAIFASVLLISGPVYVLSDPLLVEGQNTSHRQQLIDITKTEIGQLTTAIEAYQNNSNTRLGWSGRIDNTQSALDAARSELKALTIQTSTSLDWRNHAIIAVQSSVLLIVMIGQILAVIFLRKGSNTIGISKPFSVTRNSAISKSKSVPENSTDDFDRRVNAAAIALYALLPEFDGKQNRLAEALQIRPADISLVMHHRQRITNCKETVSEQALSRIEAVIL